MHIRKTARPGGLAHFSGIYGRAGASIRQALNRGRAWSILKCGFRIVSDAGYDYLSDEVSDVNYGMESVWRAERL